MRTFNKYLEEQLQNPEFAEGYEEERYLLGLSITLALERQRRGITKKQLAYNAKISQQQLSKLESGRDCNTKTLIKVCKALGGVLNIKFKKNNKNYLLNINESTRKTKIKIPNSNINLVSH
jgi:DNA-binding Xre family transcriptional regulator